MGFRGKITLIFGFLFLFLLPVSSLHVLAADRLQGFCDPECPVIVIDPGHGGENNGTMDNGFLEKSMNLITARAMYEELSRYDNVKVYLTRTEDVDMSLEERAEFAQSVGADFLFSIHYNASVNHDLFGSEVWISGQSPYHAFGYQFGYVQMETMAEEGLFLRGIKTRINDRGTDYYGIIRNSVALKIPAVIIEHCHVDEERDAVFCDEDEELIRFGKLDALSVAKYLGLSSVELGVDYSKDPLPDLKVGEHVSATFKDETQPECNISLESVDYETGAVEIKVEAEETETPLIYYRYTIDGGRSFSPLYPWPESNALTGSYAHEFVLPLQIPSGVKPMISVSAYNLFDLAGESNPVFTEETFSYGEKSVMEPEEDIIRISEQKNADRRELVIIFVLIGVLVLILLAMILLGRRIIRDM